MTPGRATTHHSFRGSFSAGSTPIFASKYAFCSIFRDLQENHLLASKLLQKFCEHLAEIYENVQNFSKFAFFFKSLPKFWQRFAEENDFLVDLEKCCKMIIWWPKSALIQPRTSLGTLPERAPPRGEHWRTLSGVSTPKRASCQLCSCSRPVPQGPRNAAGFPHRRPAGPHPPAAVAKTR